MALDSLLAAKKAAAERPAAASQCKELLLDPGRVVSIWGIVRSSIFFDERTDYRFKSFATR
jgi:hypothetical protein